MKPGVCFSVLLFRSARSFGLAFHITVHKFPLRSLRPFVPWVLGFPLGLFPLAGSFRKFRGLANNVISCATVLGPLRSLRPLSVSSGPSSVLAAPLMYVGSVYEILAARTWLAMVAVGAGVVEEVAGNANGIVEAGRLGCSGQRCSTPAMLLPTC